MRRLLLLLAAVLALCSTDPAFGDDIITDSNGNAETTSDAVRVTLLKLGGEYSVQSITGGSSSGPRQGCSWTLVFTPELESAPYGMSPGPPPDPEARFALLLCDGSIVRALWVAPSDVVDLDAAARAEAQRYVEDVLTPAVSIGVNPAAKGLAGLRSWFWIEGFAGSVTAPPISAFGLTIDVRM
jgi:hypothetical protein